MAKFNGFESRPETLEFYQNRRIWAVWGAKMAKFNGFESRPETLEFYQNRRIWAVWGAKVAKFNGFESSPVKSKIFEEPAEPGPTLYPLISEV